MEAMLCQAAPRDGEEIFRNPHVDCGKAPVAAAVGGDDSTKSPLSMGLPFGEPSVGNWSRVKHQLEGWRHQKLCN